MGVNGRDAGRLDNSVEELRARCRTAASGRSPPMSPTEEGAAQAVDDLAAGDILHGGYVDSVLP